MSFQTILTIQDMRRLTSTWKDKGDKTAFVPTMGALHEGHLKLVNEAREKAQRVVVSIFVNPLQFGPSEDYSRYPRTLAEDMQKLQAAGVDVLFAPNAVEMYPDGFQTAVFNKQMSRGLCGPFRPGHFEGVLTVVCKLFQIVHPDFALFGKKDFQQYRLIDRMVRDLAMPIEVIGSETLRESDGLAMSSRNRYLSAEQRAQASLLYTALSAAKELFQSGERGRTKLIAKVQDTIGLCKEMKIQYVELVRANDLTLPAEQLIEEPLVIALAVLYGDVRLIDNIEFGGQN